MNKTKRKELYHKAINKWGLQAQLIMLMEECAELIQATSKIIRHIPKTETDWNNFAEEIADVEIMIEQMKMNVNWQNLNERVETIKKEKLLKLKSIIEKKLD